METAQNVWASNLGTPSPSAGASRSHHARTHRGVEVGTIDSETDGFHHCMEHTCPKCQGKGRIPKPFVWGLYRGEKDEYLEFETEAELDRLHP